MPCRRALCRVALCAPAPRRARVRDDVVYGDMRAARSRAACRVPDNAASARDGY